MEASCTLDHPIISPREVPVGSGLIRHLHMAIFADAAEGMAEVMSFCIMALEADTHSFLTSAFSRLRTTQAIGS